MCLHDFFALEGVRVALLTVFSHLLHYVVMASCDSIYEFEFEDGNCKIDSKAEKGAREGDQTDVGSEEEVNNTRDIQRPPPRRRR